MANNRLRIVGGDISELIDKHHIILLGHVGIYENTLSKIYSFLGEHGIVSEIGVEDDEYLAPQVEHYFSPTISLLSKALSKEDMFLARANLLYENHWDSGGEMRLIGYGDLYKLKPNSSAK